VAARVDRPSWATTRKTFLLAVAGGALALALGRPWSLRDGRAASAGPGRPRRAENLLETVRGPCVELRPTPVDPHGPVFRLNRSAAHVWRGVDGRRTVNDLAALLAAAYGIPAAAARADTLDSLQALSGAGLVFGVYGSGNGIKGERA
jgi:Coenzyme PQQ synthesis protein D (PqqD)